MSQVHFFKTYLSDTKL